METVTTRAAVASIFGKCKKFSVARHTLSFEKDLSFPFFLRTSMIHRLVLPFTQLP
jgi:hypothetical protein